MLHHQKSTYPGPRLPHAWHGDHDRKFSTHDIAKATQFTIFTGITGQAWTDAAVEVGVRLGTKLAAVSIGEGIEVQVPCGDGLHQREVKEDGVILVRPDKHIGWRSHHMADDPRGCATAVASHSRSERYRLVMAIRTC